MGKLPVRVREIPVKYPNSEKLGLFPTLFRNDLTQQSLVFPVQLRTPGSRKKFSPTAFVRE